MKKSTMYNTEVTKKKGSIPLYQSPEERDKEIGYRDSFAEIPEQIRIDVAYLQRRFNELDASRPDTNWDLFRTNYLSPVTPSPHGLASINVSVEQATVRNKKADLQSAKPVVHLIPQEKSDIYKRDFLRVIWDYVWSEADTEKKLDKAWDDALIYGTAWWFEGVKTDVQYKPRKDMKSYEVFQRSYLQGYSPDIRDVWISPVQDIEDAPDAFIRITNITEWYLRGLIDTYEGIDKEAVKEYIAKGSQTQSNQRTQSSYTFQTNEELMDSTNDPRYTLFHYYNKEKGLFIILGASGTTFYPKPLFYGPNPYPHGEIPLSLLIDHPRPGELYGIGECELLAGIKSERNVTRQQIIDQARSSSTTNLLIDDTVSFEESELITGVMRVFNVHGNPDKAKFMQMPQLNSSLIQVDTMLRDEATIATGIDVNSLVGQPTPTAFQAKLEEHTKLKGVMNTLRHFDYFLTRVARQRLANIQAFLPRTTGKKLVSKEMLNQNRTIVLEDVESKPVVSVTDRNVREESLRFVPKKGNYEFLEISEKMIRNNMDVRVSTPTTTTVLREIESNEMEELFAELLKLGQTEQGQQILGKFNFEAYYRDVMERKGLDADKYMVQEEDDNTAKLRASIMDRIAPPGTPQLVPEEMNQVSNNINSVAPLPPATQAVPPVDQPPEAQQEPILPQEEMVQNRHRQ